MDLSLFPKINAALNAASAVLLVAGYRMIRQGRVGPHKACMLAACALSAIFLASYLYYHAHAGVTRYAREGVWRVVYFAVLLSHTALAAAVPVLAAGTLANAFRGRFDRHKRWARWTFPIWLYVSVTGVVIYVMLYHLNP